MKGGLSKEVVSDEGEFSMGYRYIYDQQRRSYKFKEVIFHEGGLSKELLLYSLSDV